MGFLLVKIVINSNLLYRSFLLLLQDLVVVVTKQKKFQMDQNTEGIYILINLSVTYWNSFVAVVTPQEYGQQPVVGGPSGGDDEAYLYGNTQEQHETSQVTLGKRGRPQEGLMDSPAEEQYFVIDSTPNYGIGGSSRGRQTADGYNRGGMPKKKKRKTIVRTSCLVVFNSAEGSHLWCFISLVVIATSSNGQAHQSWFLQLCTYLPLV